MLGDGACGQASLREHGWAERRPDASGPWLQQPELGSMAAANSNPQGKRCQAGAIWSPSNVQIVGSRAEILPLPAKNSRLRVLVPTMGGLHRGHMELVRIAREAAGKAGEVAVSIFVNPLQFEPGSDYERYPRPERNDEEVCRAAGVDLLFRPSAAEMYFDDRSVSVEEEALALSLCGKSSRGKPRVKRAK